LKSVYTERYAEFVRLMIKARQDAGLSQQTLADAIGRPQSFVSKYENRERRLDLIEFLILAELLSIDPTQLIKKLLGKPGDLRR
jgi:transcriptional regulator with XRE-family HTH domain